MVEEELHALVVDGLGGCLYGSLKHQVGLLQLVVEEEIVVGELNSQRVGMLLGKVGPEDIET